MYPIATVLLFVFIRYGRTQDFCPLPGTRTIEENVVTVFMTGDSPATPSIRIIGEVRYVCLALGLFQDTYRGISVLAEYECTGSAECPSTTAETSQFELSCRNGMWRAQVLGTTELVFTRTPVANSTTPLRTDCSFCVSPELLAAAFGDTEFDASTHCVGMSDAATCIMHQRAFTLA